MRDQEIIALTEAYASIYTNLSESHFSVGDKVTCKESGMKGEVVEVDPKEEGKYYTVEREDGKKMKYAPDELKKSNGGTSKENEEKFHSKLDKLVHKTFGKSPEEQKEEVEYFTEEVQIAAEYFYNLGLNEEGVALVVEELGTEEFYNWVQDLSEEYYLDEARRSGSIEPKTAKGQEIKGKPSASSLKRLRRLKAEREESEERASQQKPSGLTASLRRQSAVANAKKQQPKKKGVLDRVAGAVLQGVKRHNAAMGELKKMRAATAETAGKVKKAAGEFKKGFMGEETDLFDIILEYLVFEGYADTNENALVIMANMGEEWRRSIVEAGEHMGKEPKTVGKPERTGVKGETYDERRKRMKPSSGVKPA